MATKAKTTTRATKITKKPRTTSKVAAARTTKVTTKPEVKTTVRTISSGTSKRAAFFSREVRNSKTSLGAILAEFVGTFIFASLVLSVLPLGSGIAPLFIGFAFAGIVAGLSRISGGHVNPALTIAALATGAISVWRAVGYVIAQFLGGMAALATASSLSQGKPVFSQFTGELTSQTEIYKLTAFPTDHYWLMFFAQAIGMAVFAFLVATLWNRKANGATSGITAGFGLMTGLFIAGTTFAVLNPAVAVALQGLATFNWETVGMYIFAPIVGAVVGAWLCKVFAFDVKHTEDVKA